MFGGNLEPPKYAKRSRPRPMTYDIQLPTLTSGLYAHRGRQPNTDYHVRLLHHKQRLRDAETHFLAAEAKRLLQDATSAKYDKHFDKKTFQRLIKDRFEEKVKLYDQSIEERRKKLRELLCRDEQEEIYLTIEAAQKGVETKMEDMKQRAQLLKAQREKDRLEIVRKKRIEQHANSCTELRPVLAKRNLMDSKHMQLLQIQENEMRREAERELDSMWYDMMIKEIEAKMEREEHDMLKRNRLQTEMMQTWDQQIQGKQLLKAKEEQIAAEDRMEMVKLQEQIRREEIEALDAKRRKRDQRAKELQEQIALQEKFLAQRNKEEKALEEAFTLLAAQEIERERQKIQNTTLLAMRETAIYRQHLKKLEEERKNEERELLALLEVHKKAIEKKQDEARCKLRRAREELQKNVLAGRAEQLEYKRQEAENQLNLKQAENELIRMACETNERLQAEHDRLQAESIREYREDLKRQIEFNDDKRRKEQEDLQRELAEGLAEEERYRKKVQDLIKLKLEHPNHKHPFRSVLEKETCHCPTGN